MTQQNKAKKSSIARTQNIAAEQVRGRRCIRVKPGMTYDGQAGMTYDGRAGDDTERFITYKTITSSTAVKNVGKALVEVQPTNPQPTPPYGRRLESFGRSSSLQIHNQLHRAMVGAEDLVVDAGGRNTVTETLGDNEIINAPPDVLFTGLEAVGPP